MFVVRTLSLVIFLSVSALLQAKEAHIYVGTYTGGESKGIYLLGFDTDNGKLTHKGLAGESENPSFIAIHDDGRHLYAANETGTGELSSFEIDKSSGKLRLLNKKPSGGGAPCHLVVDKAGTSLLVANYSGGNISSTKINSDGSLGSQVSFFQHYGASTKSRQKEPHAHSINLDAANRFAIAADLGTDQLFVYKFDALTGTLTRHGSTHLKAGSGPRHFSFHPNGTHAYAINELASTISALEYNALWGTFRVIQDISTLPADFDGKSFTAEVRVSSDGKFVYGSNRGHDSIAVLQVQDDGRLKQVQVEPIGGKTPRNFNIDPTGKFLLAAGQATDNIQVFAIDSTSGKLTKTAHSVSVPSPVCIRFAK